MRHRILITVSCVIFSIVALNASAQTVNIPDANLRAAVAETLGKAPRATITQADMAKLTHFIAHDANIRNLTGLEFATDLEEIRCNNNLISDLSPLSTLTGLHTVEFRHNVIKDLSAVAGLINLRWLVVPYNLIADLSPVKGLVKLHGLDIGGNVITDYSALSGLIKLERIWMGENPSADLSPLSGLISLTGYQSWGTPIFNVSALAELPKLTSLDICGGELSDLADLADFTNLRELYLAGNEITDISPLASLTNLTSLNLKHNRITEVSPLSGLTNLRRLYLEHNSISDFSPLSELSEHTIISKRGNPSIPQGTSVHNYNGTPAAGPKITGPWLWVILPGTWLGSRDFLAEVSGGGITEQSVATVGAKEGKSVGNSKWRAHTLSATSHNNINEMTDALGWGTGWEIYDHIVYGSVSLQSPREQETTMLVGSDDAVKVWLNGELVHEALVDRPANDYQDAFPVTLKRGTNVLLVAIDNNGHGEFSGFFGFEAGTAYTVNPTDKRIVVNLPPSDVNKDGRISILDLILVAQDFGKTGVRNSRTDINNDGKVNILDLTRIAERMNAATGAAAPFAVAMGNSVSPAMIETWIALAAVENDGSRVFREGIANLQRLLASLRPERTMVLANYPNPFNPETWIPYQLARDAAVRIDIYTTDGRAVQTLVLGHQPAGMYQDKSRAAYWDGKNAFGEPVASGLYFYTLTAGDFTATRKMLIRK
ncbi:MAG: leucine-rich repeat domain-containing protein [Candidatus Poribacteria bacterium]|nr:leucine-rich repeat domain-containing protein [Candidatus Poribacteria bacterium]